MLAKFASVDCAGLESLEEGATALVGGMISRLRTTITKNGRNAGSKLAILTFEDLTGNIEAVVYSEELEKFRDLIGPDALVFLIGKVDKRRENASLRVSEVIALEDGPARLAEAVIVNLRAVGLDPGMLERLKDVCRAHRGDRKLFIRVKSPGELVTLVRCDEGLGIRPDDSFTAALDKLLGPGCGEIIGRRREPPRRRAEPPPASSVAVQEPDLVAV